MNQRVDLILLNVLLFDDFEYVLSFQCNILYLLCIPIEKHNMKPLHRICQYANERDPLVVICLLMLIPLKSVSQPLGLQFLPGCRAGVNRMLGAPWLKQTPPLGACQWSCHINFGGWG